MIGQFEDELERRKRYLSGGEPAKLKGLTIWEYYWELNEKLRLSRKKPAKTP